MPYTWDTKCTGHNITMILGNVCKTEMKVNAHSKFFSFTDTVYEFLGRDGPIYHAQLKIPTVSVFHSAGTAAVLSLTSG